MKYDASHDYQIHRLPCGKVEFYVEQDREAFFEYLSAVDCVVNAIEQEDTIFIDIAPGQAAYWPNCIDELQCLFRRYHIDMQPLRTITEPQYQSFFTRNPPPVAHIYQRHLVSSNKATPLLSSDIVYGNTTYCLIERKIIDEWLCKTRHRDFRHSDQALKSMLSLFTRYEIIFNGHGYVQNLATIVSPAAEQMRIATEQRWLDAYFKDVYCYSEAERALFIEVLQSIRETIYMRESDIIYIDEETLYLYLDTHLSDEEKFRHMNLIETLYQREIVQPG